MARGPRCLRCRMFMLYGPVELLFLASFIACTVCCVVMGMLGLGSCFMSLSIFLLVLFVLCMVEFTNCLLKRSALSLFVMDVL